LDIVRATFLKKSLVIYKSFSGPGADTESGVVYREHVDAYLGMGSSSYRLTADFAVFWLQEKRLNKDPFLDPP
jgi:hypothetical protein